VKKLATVKEAQLNGIIDYSNQRDFYDPVSGLGNISVIGAGGIGSPTCMGLARMGIPKITIYDYDKVEPHNIPTQHYRIDDVGEFKVDAISKQIKTIGFSEVRSQNKTITSNDVLLGDIVISAVDSMESRKNVFEAAKRSPSVKHLIDARLGGELIMCICIDIRDSEQVEWYLSDEMMFDDSESESNVCTARGIYDVGLAVSALICRTTRMLLANQEVQKLQMLNMNNLRLDIF
jgi:molybdopterin/thiamine biosynthesis adenylyltransferase